MNNDGEMNFSAPDLPVGGGRTSATVRVGLRVLPSVDVPSAQTCKHGVGFCHKFT